jgi:hypothetical protein
MRQRGRSLLRKGLGAVFFRASYRKNLSYWRARAAGGAEARSAHTRVCSMFHIGIPKASHPFFGEKTICVSSGCGNLLRSVANLMLFAECS